MSLLINYLIFGLGFYIGLALKEPMGFFGASARSIIYGLLLGIIFWPIGLIIQIICVMEVISPDTPFMKIENEVFAICLITDNHKAHLKSHIKYFYKPRIIKHMLDHLYLWYRAKKVGIPHISLEEVMSSIRGLKK